MSKRKWVKPVIREMRPGGAEKSPTKFQSDGSGGTKS